MWLKLVICSLLFVGGCQTKFNYAQETKNALIKRNIWAEVLTYQVEDVDTNRVQNREAVVFVYPGNETYMYAYDKRGSFKLFSNKKDSPLEIALHFEYATGNNLFLIEKAKFQ